MKGRRIIVSFVIFFMVTLGTFILLHRAGHGFPGINAGPGQLIVSDTDRSEENLPMMIHVQGSNFRMGDPTGASYSALPVREVEITDFFISRYEITFALYDRYCRAEGLPLPPDSGYGRQQRPVGNVSWFDAVRYCNWLSRTEALEPCYLIKWLAPAITYARPEIVCDYTKNGYRLPTEAEWEYAASGGLISRGFMYAGSDTVEEVAWYFNNAGRYPEPVGRKLPNELGLYDMSGNVFEWTNSLLTGNYSKVTDGSVNLVGGETGTTPAIRGGSCFFDSWGCRVWYRKGCNQEQRLPYVGFRVVRRAPP